MKTYAIIANPKSQSNSGWNACKEQIQEALDGDVFLLTRPMDEIVGEICEKGYETIVAVGGDGTISTAVDAMMRLYPEAILGIIPAGTLNHFSKDAKIPQKLDEALRAITSGHTAFVDVGVVNERHFINNSSVGLYPLLVLDRERFQKAGHTKWVSLFRASLKHASSYSGTKIRLGTEGTSKRVSNVFIGNNRYSFEGISLGSRESLTEGTLALAVLNPLRASGYAWLAAKALTGKALSDTSVNVIGVSRCTIESNTKSLLVSYDGEIARMSSPLSYSIKPKALRIIVPAQAQTT